MDKLFFIKASQNYNQINSEDGVLVYGYNLTHQILYCSGFVDGHYKQFETSFNEFKDAIYNEYEDNLYTKNISLIKYDKTYKHTFSKHELYLYVYDYLYSQDHSKKFSLLLIKITGTAFHIMIKSTNNFATIIKICD